MKHSILNSVTKDLKRGTTLNKLDNMVTLYDVLLLLHCKADYQGQILEKRLVYSMPRSSFNCFMSDSLHHRRREATMVQAVQMDIAIHEMEYIR